MKIKMLTLAALICLVCLGAGAQDVYVTSSPSGTFSEYHTYAWGKQPNPNQIASPIMAQEAQTQINTQLQAKGLRLVQESENPDLIVVGSGGMRAETSYTAMGMRGFGGGIGTITPQQNVVGTLIVDTNDLKAKQMVWRGVAQGTLNQKNSQKNMQLLDKAVVKMFKKYPS
jgi:hypothetical protein